MSDIGQQLREHWISKGLKVRPGVSDEVLTNFEAKHRVALPDDLRAYFSEVNGVETADTDQIYFWPVLSTSATPNPYDCFVRPVSSLNEQTPFEGWERYFVFADYCLWCSLFFIKLSPDASTSTPVFFHALDCQIAESFSDFAEQYIQGKVPMQEKV